MPLSKEKLTNIDQWRMEFMFHDILNFLEHTPNTPELFILRSLLARAKDELALQVPEKIVNKITSFHSTVKEDTKGIPSC